MNKVIVSQKFKDHYLIARIFEIESIITLLQISVGDGEDQLTLRNALRVLDNCMEDLHVAACWETEEANQNAGVQS